MNPERALHFLADLHLSGWVVVLGQRYTVACHATWGAVMGRGDDFASMLDDLRAELRKRELCE